MITSDTLDVLLPALVKARGDFKPVVRDATGQVAQRAYKYADLAGVLDAIVPALTKHGLTVAQTVDAETSTLITRLLHTSGQWIESRYPLTFAGQTPQQIGAQLSYGRRYSLLALLCVAQEDDDAAGVPAHPPAQATPQSAPQTPSTPPVYREAHVLKVDFDEGVSAKTQKPWSRYRITFDDQTPMATTFSKTLGDAAREALELGALVQYSTEVTPKGVNLVSIEPALF
jgi:hypothetical protein